MAATYIPIASTTLATTAASVTFSSIPATYTDLVLRISVRMSVSGPDNVNVKINSFINSHSYTHFYASNGSAASSRATGVGFFRLNNILPGTESTANTFGSGECYFPSYAGSANKTMGHFGAGESNSTTIPYITATAGLLSQTAAITSLTITPAGGNFVSDSSFHLYGILNT
jgi:hypothetical protein